MVESKFDKDISRQKSRATTERQRKQLEALESAVSSSSTSTSSSSGGGSSSSGFVSGSSEVPLKGGTSTTTLVDEASGDVQTIEREVQPTIVRSSGGVRRTRERNAVLEPTVEPVNTSVTQDQVVQRDKVIRALTEEEKRRATFRRFTNPLRDFASGVIDPFGTLREANNQDLSLNKFDRNVSEAQIRGAFLGIPLFTVGGSATSGVRAAKGAAGRVAKSAPQTVTRGIEAAQESKALQGILQADRALQSNVITRLGRGVGIATGQGLIITESAKQVGKATLSSDQKAALQGKDFDAAVSAGFRAQTETLQEQGTIKGIASALPIVPNFLAGDSFEKASRQQLRSQGLEGNELDLGVAASVRQRNIQSAGEGLALLKLSQATEAFGRAEVGRKFSESAGKKLSGSQGFQVAKSTFFPIGRAGVVEGVSGVVAQQRSRNEALNPVSIGLGGAFGFGTAGLLGAAIAGGRAARSAKGQTFGRVTEVAANIADPFEKAGDLLQDANEAVARRVGRTVRTPTITGLDSDSFVFGVTESPTPSRTEQPTGGLILDSGSDSRVQKFPPRPNRVPQQPELFPTRRRRGGGGSSGGSSRSGRAPTLEEVVNQNILPVPSQQKTPSNTREPVIVPVTPSVLIPEITPRTPSIIGESTVPINPDPFIPVPPVNPTILPEATILQEQRVTTTTPTTTINFPVNIPASTPIVRVPPPVPFSIPLQANFFGSKGKKQRKTIDELDQALKAFQLSLGGISPLKKPSNKKGKSRRKKRRK